MIRILITLLLVTFSNFAFGNNFAANANYQVCFTPAQDCAGLIVAAINQAQKEVLVQAYSFTSAPIAKALIQAQKRGVNVKIILDKSQTRQRGFSSAKLFADYHIPVLIDYKTNIAHNKVMIIDSKTVITGSYNFTRAAQERNIENVLIISDQDLARKYLLNWHSRAKVSEVARTPASPFD
jgi:phosphatidylserine/phosphatidylglycerophosphate/cardiolipin synthase-like enzyme